MEPEMSCEKRQRLNSNENEMKTENIVGPVQFDTQKFMEKAAEALQAQNIYHQTTCNMLASKKAKELEDEIFELDMTIRRLVEEKKNKQEESESGDKTIREYCTILHAKQHMFTKLKLEIENRTTVITQLQTN